MVPIQIILPLVISRYTTGPKPLSIFLKAMPYRCALVIRLKMFASAHSAIEVVRLFVDIMC